MIISAEYEERIYDIESPWNTSEWTWIKFEEDSGKIWVGQFRGEFTACGISVKHGIAVIITSMYICFIDLNCKEMIDYGAGILYKDIYQTVDGDILLSDGYSLSVVNGNAIDSIKNIELPIKADFLKFDSCSGNLLRLTCEEVCNWDESYEIFLDCKTFSITKWRMNNG